MKVFVLQADDPDAVVLAEEPAAREDDDDDRRRGDRRTLPTRRAMSHKETRDG